MYTLPMPSYATKLTATLKYGACLLLLVLAACSDAEKPATAFRVANQGLLSAAYSADGQLLFIGAITEGGSLWRSAAPARLYDWNHATDEPSAIQAAAFSADGKLAATAAGDSLALWSTDTGASSRYWHSPTPITAVDISANGAYALLGQENNTAVLFNLERGGVVGSLRHEDSVSGIAMDDQATLALTGSVDGKVRVWSLATGKVNREWLLPSPISLVQLSPSGRLALAAGSRAAEGLWDTGTGELQLQLHQQNPAVTIATFSEDESQLLVGTAREMVELWDLQTGTQIKSWHLPGDGPWQKAVVVALAWSSTPGQFLATAANGFTYTLE
jgi:WD40 repeat protein